MADLNQIIKEIVKKNDWLSGMADFREGDLMALVNQPEKFESATEISDLKQLYQDLRNYDGVFKYRNLLFFNDWQYGTFVYDIHKPKDYIEHLSMNVISFENFQKIVKRLV